MKKKLSILVLASIAALQVHAGPVQFEDTSDKLGFTRGTETWGIAWGNLNTDKYPDLWNSGHRDFPRLYRNTGTGDFDDVTMWYDHNQNGYWITDTQRDVHGGAWGDYDNDGDDDLLVGDAGELFINQATTDGFFGVSSLEVMIQNAAWNDTDGERDLESDVSCNITAPGNTRTGQYILLFDADVDGDMDEICAGEGTFPYSVSNADPSLIPTIGLVNDTALGDFNNDLRTDMVMTRGATRTNGAAKVNDRRIDGWFKGNGRGFTFSAPGEVRFIIDGRGGSAFKKADEFILNTGGNNAASARGIDVSYSDSSQLWTAEQRGGSQAYIRIIAQNTVSEPAMFGLTGADLPVASSHGVNTPSGFQWVSGTGLSQPKSCVSVVAADFDNDMDVDVYMACRNGVQNLANRYFDNDGDGTFTEVFSHGGEGPIGAGIEFGLSDSVITADYDVDGFIDLAVSNGLLFYPVSLGGPDTLIRNQGNNNHWIEIDLIGTVSPRAAIGAKVYLTAGGITQLREQSAGYHRWSQNHSRIHFGLASNTTVDQIRIEWPSGLVDVFSNVSADRLYDATENGGISAATLLAPGSVNVEAGEECGKPAYTSTLGPALLVWRECGTDNWRLRAKGGLGRLTEGQDLTIAGSLAGSGNFGAVSAASTSSGDLVDNSVSSIINFSLTVQENKTNTKGLNFSANGQSITCLDISAGSNIFERVYLGSMGKRIDLPYDISGLGVCNLDSDGDGIINSLDPDDDNDGVLDVNDTFPLDPQESQDSDLDGVGDNADIFPNDPTETQDSDGDGIGNNSDIDRDNDGITNADEQTLITSTNLNAAGNESAFGGQDVSKDFTISPDGLGITLRNNTWRKTNSTYNITPTTIIEFDFKSSTEGEVQAIGFSNGASIDGNDYFVFSGTQTFGIRDFVYNQSNQTQHFIIKVGDYYTGNNLNLVFINDDDVGLASDSTYSNIEIYDSQLTDPDIDRDNLSNELDLDSDNDGIADVIEAGLIDANGDFIVDNANGSPITLPDTDGDHIPDFLDLESNNAANDGTNYDLHTTAFVSLDTNNDGTLNNGDTNGGNDADEDGIDDLIDGNPNVYGNGAALPVDDSCFEPVYDRALEQAVFLWKDCANGQWNVRFTGGGDASGAEATGTVRNDAGFTAVDGFSIEKNDTLDNSTNSAVINYQLRVWNSAQDGFSFTPISSNTCFSVESGTPLYLGENKMPFTSPLNLDSLGNCSLPVDPAECGEPTYDRKTEPGLFLWKECNTGSANSTWHLRVAGGGLAWSPYIGSLVSDRQVTATAEQLEANDTIDGDLNDNGLDFILNVAGPALDGIDFVVPADSQTCFGVTQQPATSKIYIGRNRLLLTNKAFNLEDLGDCL